MSRITLRLHQVVILILTIAQKLQPDNCRAVRHVDATLLRKRPRYINSTMVHIMKSNDRLAKLNEQIKILIVQESHCVITIYFWKINISYDKDSFQKWNIKNSISNKIWLIFLNAYHRKNIDIFLYSFLWKFLSIFKYLKTRIINYVIFSLI